MTNLLRFDFNDRDGIFEVVENGDWVRATDYDALAAKLAEVEAERDKFHLLWKDACVRSGKNSLRADAAEAALPAVYRLALGDAAERFDEIAQHDQGGIDYSDLVGIPISNREQLVKSVQDAERDAKAIRALPTPTADELMARIQTGEKQ